MPTPDEMINELVARADAYMEHKHVIKPQKKQKKVLDNYFNLQYSCVHDATPRLCV
jgi:type IV secretory pathway VirD2 relaxase